MNKIALILSFIAGLSTLIGYFFIYIKNKNNIISKALGFASGVMITISITDLMPNSFSLILEHHNLIYTLFLILIGFLIGILISSIVDRKLDKNVNNGLKLYKIGIITMLVIMLHNIPEGIATYITTSNNLKLGIILTLAIALHNIPEGISISIPIYYSTKSKKKAFLYTFISGISEPIGAIICYLFLYKYITNDILGIIYSIISGMMINIGINELYKEAYSLNKKYTYIYFTLGLILILVNHFIFN